MKAALGTVLLLVSALAVAQQSPSQPLPGKVTPRQMEAPQLGHPLDPEDVAILTGKADAAARQAQQIPYPAYYDYPLDTTWFDTSQFATPFASNSWAVRNRFSIARFRRNPFFFISRGVPRIVPIPSPFLFHRGRGHLGEVFFDSQRPFLLGPNFRR